MTFLKCIAPNTYCIIYYIYIVRQQRILRIAYGRLGTSSFIHSHCRRTYLLYYYVLRAERREQKKNRTRISYTYIMFIYYYARLTTGCVLFFHRLTNTENPPAVDNRNIHHNIYSFPIDTFIYFCAEDKKNRKVLSAFSAIFPPLVLFGDSPGDLPRSSHYI